MSLQRHDPFGFESQSMSTASDIWASESVSRPAQLCEVPSPSAPHPLIAAYRPWGGMVEGETLARTLQERGTGDFSLLAKAVVARQIISIEHGHRLWIPAFQFRQADGCVKPHVQRVALHLKDVFDAQALAAWFVERNSWLRNQRPIELIDTRFGDVWQAACADRFVAGD